MIFNNLVIFKIYFFVFLKRLFNNNKSKNFNINHLISTRLGK
jgi:hypothetical protein